MDKVTLHELAALAITGTIDVLRFGPDGRTAIIKYKEPGSQKLTEIRVIPEKDPGGIDRYDVGFLNSLTSG